MGSLVFEGGRLSLRGPGKYIKPKAQTQTRRFMSAAAGGIPVLFTFREGIGTTDPLSVSQAINQSIIESLQAMTNQIIVESDILDPTSLLYDSTYSAEYSTDGTTWTALTNKTAVDVGLGFNYKLYIRLKKGSNVIVDGTIGTTSTEPTTSYAASYSSYADYGSGGGYHVMYMTWTWYAVGHAAGYSYWRYTTIKDYSDTTGTATLHAAPGSAGWGAGGGFIEGNDIELRDTDAYVMDYVGNATGSWTADFAANPDSTFTASP